jgi:ubiquinone/menaquinone biosynthesis C-methylase UbiE
MKRRSTWKDFWEAKFASRASDYEADRGAGKRDEVLDRLATEELLEFIRPRPDDVVFDAGCGTGVNVVLLHDLVRRIIAIDFAESAIRRAQHRLAAAGVQNATVSQGDILSADLHEGSVDKVLCLSVFHYLTDDQIRACLRSFKRVLRKDGILVIHVKNLASPYLATLYAAKRLRRMLGRPHQVLEEYFRSFGWYRRELESAGFEIEEFNSFNLLVLDRMPTKLVEYLQKLELTHRKRFPLAAPVLRRHGSDLKFRARASR